MDKPSCPICGDDSNVEKISSMSLPSAGVSGKIAKLLVPPPNRTITGPIEFLSLFAALLLIPGAWFFILWRPERFDAMTMISINVGVVVAAVALYLVGRSSERGYREREAEKYRQVLERWNCAFYCAVHDVAFVAGESLTAAPSQFAELLHVPSAIEAA